MKKRYRLYDLLEKQPPALKKTFEFKRIIELYNSSDYLKLLRFNKKCYSLLLHAKVTPENLNYFYRAYGLKAHPFFPLFLKVKNEYFHNITLKKKRKEKEILNLMKSLPQDIQEYIRYLGKFERALSSQNRSPIWSKMIYPKTKKRVEEYNKQNRINWITLFQFYFSLIQKKYPHADINYMNKLLALFILELPILKYSPEEIKTQYRKLSKKYHPDLGGNAEYFNYLQIARDIYLIPSEKK